jgi:hypothetical protein
MIDSHSADMGSAFLATGVCAPAPVAVGLG